LANYRIFETETFQEDLARISRSGLGRMKEKLQEHVYPRLRDNPHFGPNIKRLKHWEPPTFRYRIGSWRFFYEIHEKEKIVYMTVADHRGHAYR
jgi:mRNA interferase RelE/StbE